jgi:hypothetical protein
MRRRILVALVGWAAFLAVTATVPAWWCRRGAEAWLKPEPVPQQALARHVERTIRAGVGLTDFHTGDDRFDGEWLFGSLLMAGLGHLQLAVADPAAASSHLAVAELCIGRMLEEPVRRFDREAWHVDALDASGTDGDHAAYLGYFNLLLGFDRLLHPATRHAALNDRITAHLVARIEATPGLLLQSYPGELYPVDNCAVIGSIGLHQRATGTDHRDLLARWSAACRTQWRDPASGLLFQSFDPLHVRPADDPRGSGTALGLYFLSFADPALAAELYAAMSRSLKDSLLGFGAFREYPRGTSGTGDIDSGPVVFGLGLSATGFGLAGARLFDDREQFRRLYGSAVFAGAPVRRNGEFQFATGGPLGNAILLAMLTALPPGRLPAGVPVR